MCENSVQASGAQRKALADQGQTLLSTASALFDKGFQKLLDMRQAVGFRTINPGSGVQPGQPLPTIVPLPIKGSPTPSASPSA